MNPEITLDDYKNIGTMDKALSDHADEAFFELSPEQQKIAEKIFKCLTETDSENREIRRAMTVEKLCAVAEADLKQVTDVIDVFRKEGRTFLMPPVEEVDLGALRESSLIDISHESLIRKWERLKNWVEEEGQSARLYRRLAEDALLNKQQKMGFWSDPELKDALEWRAQFNPNATWAALYKETGTRQFKASFDESMNYLDASKANQEAELAAEELQRSRLKRYANRLTATVVGLFFLLLMSIAAAGFAWYQRAAANRINAELTVEKTNVESSKQRLQETADRLDLEKREKDKAYDDLKLKTDDLNQKTDELELKESELSESLEEQKKATERAEEQKQRAELNEAEKQKALEREKGLSEQAQKDKDFAELKRKEAVAALEQANATSAREEINRSALVFLEQGELKRALPKFEELLTHYENQSEVMTKKSRIDGKWWASHNLGIVYSKMLNSFPDSFRNAECYYKQALGALGEKTNPGKCAKSQSQNPVEHFQQTVAYQIDKEEIDRNKVTTLRRLAQLYREKAENTASEREAIRLNEEALRNYDQLLDILPMEVNFRKEPVYPADVSVEMADTLTDLYSYDLAKKYYSGAVSIYEEQKDFVKLASTFKRWSNSALWKKHEQDAIKYLEEAIRVQENEMKLSPVNSEIAQSYTDLASIYNNLPTDLQTPEMQENAVKYNNLSRNINNLSYKETRTGNFDTTETFKIFNDFEKLTEAYIEIGKCDRAEQSYIYAKRLFQATDPLAPNAYELTVEELHFISRLGWQYWKIRRDDEKAKETFKEFVDGLESSVIKAEGDYSGGDKYDTVGDFYFEQGDYDKAKRFYEQARLANHTVLKRYLETDRNFADTYSWKKGQAAVKKSAALEKLNTAQSLREAEAELLRLLEEETDIIFFPKDVEKALRLVYLADFYDRRGNQEKAAEYYIDANNSFANNSLTGSAIKARIFKRLLDINRSPYKGYSDDRLYQSAFENLQSYGLLVNDLKNTPEKEYRRYSKNGKLTLEYYTDQAEILEAWSKLPNVSKAEDLKIRARDARAEVENFKSKVEKSPCKQ